MKLTKADSEKMLRDLAARIAPLLTEHNIREILLPYYPERDLVGELFRRGWQRPTRMDVAEPPAGTELLWKLP